MDPRAALRRWSPRVLVFLLAGGSIAALLADLYGVAPMAPVFWFVSVPTMAVLAVAASLPRVDRDLRTRIRVGTVAGVLGVIGYDVVRIPFALAGQRVFAPIESYGLLIADASSSSGLTSTLGWLYHLSNGVTFGIAYVAIAARRPWPLGVVWALLLETVAVLSPFAARYGLSGHLVPIAIAYLAHVFYGYPLGRLGHDLDGTEDALRGFGRHTVSVTLVVAVAVIVGWHRPWHVPPTEREAARLSQDGVPATIVRSDRFEPEWLRIRAGGCVLIDNRSGRAYSTTAGSLPAGVAGTLCFDQPGVHRIRLGTRPYSGGFVYVDATGS
ncbi:hypothetical protein ACIA5D_15215 [Actinoplanes sp. NPDC051513]|uniref:hypothetical protein n=1 Tax=Actinoplanes sp. NPDC051513 TaxID=3363908 RepID=UPI0037B0ADDC